MWMGPRLRAVLPLGPPPSQTPWLLRGVDVLDPRDGSLRERQDVAIEAGCIRAIGPTGRWPRAGQRSVDGAGGVALPGLIDCHAHVCGAYLSREPTARDLRWILRQIAKNLRAFVRSGVTTVRDMAGPLHLSRALRWLGRQGRLTSPRLLVPGPILSVQGGYPTYVAPSGLGARVTLGPLRIDLATPAEASAAVDYLAARGVDLVKVAYTSADYDDAHTPLPLLSGALLRAVTERAHAHRLPVAVHHIFAHDLPSLLGLPFDTLEHLSIEAELGEAEVERIRRRGLPVTTTLMTYGIVDYLDELATLVADDAGVRFEAPAAAEVARLVREIQTGSFRIPFIGRSVIQTGMTLMLRNLRRLREAGVLVGAGTDAGGAITPCGKIAWELRAMVRAGYRPLEALRAATSDAARVLGRPELGVLAAGRPADLVVCRGNPAESLDALEHIELVVRDGRILFAAGEGDSSSAE